MEMRDVPGIGSVWAIDDLLCVKDSGGVVCLRSDSEVTRSLLTAGELTPATEQEAETFGGDPPINPAPVPNLDEHHKGGPGAMDPGDE